jgi:hypothetical protein
VWLEVSRFGGIEKLGGRAFLVDQIAPAFDDLSRLAGSADWFTCVQWMNGDGPVAVRD